MSSWNTVRLEKPDAVRDRGRVERESVSYCYRAVSTFQYKTYDTVPHTLEQQTPLLAYLPFTLSRIVTLLLERKWTPAAVDVYMQETQVVRIGTRTARVSVARARRPCGPAWESTEAGHRRQKERGKKD